MSDQSDLSVNVIGGYLGSGKTTLVNHLLRNADGRRLAVLVNEFGELAIDADLIEAEKDGLISIAGGCICCSFGNDLIGAMRDLARMRPRPDHILIESSGVALPGAIAATIGLIGGFHANGIVVLVDSETVRKLAADDYVGDTITRQLADADIVVMNKLDLVTRTEAERLRNWLESAAPGATPVPARFGQVPGTAILGIAASPRPGPAGAHSDALYESMVLVPPSGVDAATLANALALGGHGVVRAKGHVIGADGASWLIQTVGKRAQAAPSDRPAQPGVICLGLRGQLNRDELERLVT